MRFRAAVAAALSILVTSRAMAAGHDVPTLAAAARRSGLRVIEGSRLVLATDRPIRPGDGIDDLPRWFDEAFLAWCRHYRIDPATHHDWRSFGCLIVDRERFRAAGLLPDTLPDFTNGFCDRNRFWLMDQSNPDYRRHLLLHEGVHAFTITLRDLDAPPWYAEGIAEMLATHRLEPDAHGTQQLIITPIPRSAADVEQLGRIEAIRRLRTAGLAPSLEDVFAMRAAPHGDLAAYASSWAVVALLSRHPRHAGMFATMERGPLDATMTGRLTGSTGWDAATASRDFDAFTDDVDYGYDITRSAIDWALAPRLEDRVTLRVAADRGWQNAGVSLARGDRYSIQASGRVVIGTTGDITIESEPDGISLDWYRGRPVGRLLAAQWVEGDEGSRPRFIVLAEGASGDITARADGPIYFKINEPPGALADNKDSFTVNISVTKNP
ncbi:MAG: hypothetical protein ACKOYJ_05755 [Planctomycetia bacterium]